MASRVTRPGAEMMKWWSKGYHEPGRITRHLSPFQQRPAYYLFKSMPEKTIRKVKENGLILGMTAGLVWGTIAWAEHEHDRYHRSHWS